MAAKHPTTKAAAHHPIQTDRHAAEWVRDFSTHQAEVSYKSLPLGEYLTTLEIYHPDTHEVNPFPSERIALDVQRAEIRIPGNHIKERMVETLLSGGLLPALALQVDDDQRLFILDGLQRTHAAGMALDWLHHWYAEDTESIPASIKEILTKLAESKQLLSVGDYLQRPVFLQLWRGLTPAESTRLFAVLNVGQQRVSMRHLMESMNHQIEDLFTSWGIHSYSEKAQRAAPPRRRGRRPKSEAATPKGPAESFKLEYLINATRAYVTRDPHVKSRATLEAAYKAGGDALREMGPELVDRVTQLGEEAAKSDFQYVFQDLHSEVSRIYAGKPKWADAMATSDNVTFPLLAAIGHARESDAAKLDSRKAQLLQTLQSADPGEDPLQLSEGEGSLDAILSHERPNKMGKVCRSLVYSAAGEYFRIGPVDEVIFDWVEGYKRMK